MKKLEKTESSKFEQNELTDAALQNVFGGKSITDPDTYTHYDDNTGANDGPDPLS